MLAATSATLGAASAQGAADLHKPSWVPGFVTSDVGSNPLADFNRNVSEPLARTVQGAIPAKEASISYGTGPQGSTKNGPEQKSSIKFADIAQIDGNKLIQEVKDSKFKDAKIDEYPGSLHSLQIEVNPNPEDPNGTKVDYSVDYKQIDPAHNHISQITATDYYPGGYFPKDTYSLTEGSDGDWTAEYDDRQGPGESAEQNLVDQAAGEQGFAGNRQLILDGNNADFHPLTTSDSQQAVDAIIQTLDGIKPPRQG